MTHEEMHELERLLLRYMAHLDARSKALPSIDTIRRSLARARGRPSSQQARSAMSPFFGPEY